jgi:hypothetical protein
LDVELGVNEKLLMFLKKITYNLIVILVITVLGCKEQNGPCVDPPNFYVSLKFID